MSPALVALNIFAVGSCDFYAQASLDQDPHICASRIAGMIGTHHHNPQFLLIEIVVSRTFYSGWP
jgi:hypothetical protein